MLLFTSNSILVMAYLIASVCGWVERSLVIGRDTFAIVTNEILLNTVYSFFMEMISDCAFLQYTKTNHF